MLAEIQVNGGTAVANATSTVGAPAIVGGSVGIEDGLPHHLAMTVSNSGCTLYIDGVSQGSDTWASGTWGTHQTAAST